MNENVKVPFIHLKKSLNEKGGIIYDKLHIMTNYSTKIGKLSYQRSQKSCIHKVKREDQMNKRTNRQTEKLYAPILLYATCGGHKNLSTPVIYVHNNWLIAGQLVCGLLSSLCVCCYQ